MGLKSLKKSADGYKKALLDESRSRLVPYSNYANNPVEFCCEVLEVKPTPEQILIMESVRDRAITNVKAAHGVGKCVAQNDKILLAQGTELPAKYLVGKEFYVLTIVDGVVRPVKAMADWNEIEIVYEITTETGRRIIRNANHPLWAGIKWSRDGGHPIIDSRGWTAISDMKEWTINPPKYETRFQPNNWDVSIRRSHSLICAVPQEIPVFGDKELPEHEVKLIAYLIGDGGLTTLTPVFTQSNGKQLDEFRQCAKIMGCVLIPKGKYGYAVTSPINGRHTHQGLVSFALHEAKDFTCEHHISTTQVKNIMSHGDNTLYGRLRMLKLKPTQFFGKAYLSTQEFDAYKLFDKCMKLSANAKIKGSVRGNQKKALELLHEQLGDVIIKTVDLELLGKQKRQAIYATKVSQGIQPGVRRNGVKPNPVAQMLKRHGLIGKGSQHKTIPASIFELPKHQLALFISRLYSTDGWACVSKPSSSRTEGNAEIGFCSISYELIEQLQRLLLRFGIIARIDKKPKVNAWTLCIHSSEMLLKFAQEIGIFGKEVAVNKVTERAKSAYSNKRRQKWRYDNAPMGTVWEKVVSIRQLEQQQQTVAIEVPGYNHYLTNFWEHNSLIAAVCVLYWVFAVGGTAITTAPTEDQVKDILWHEVRKLYDKHKYKLGGERGVLFVRLSENARAWGFTSRNYDTNSFQGKHAELLMLIQDEADGVTEIIDDGFRSCLTGSKNRGLRIGNPVDSFSNFAKICKRDRNVLTIPAFSHPNVSWAYQLNSDGVFRLKPEVAEKIVDAEGEIKPQDEWDETLPRDLIPGAISIDWIETARRDKFEGSAFWVSRVLGQYPEDSTDGIIPLSYLKAARARYDANPEHWDALARNYNWTLGLDVGDGGDNHALALLRGPVLYKVEIHPTIGDMLDTERAADIASAKMKLLGNCRIAVDNTGIGAGTLAKLVRAGVLATGCKFGDSASTKNFINRKAELNWLLREMLRKGEFAIAPLANEDYVFQDLAATRYTTNTKDQIMCEPKEKTRGRLGRSPDSEAVIIAMHLPMLAENQGQIDKAVVVDELAEVREIFKV